MTNYIFPPKDKTLYGLTTGTVYEPGVSEFLPWEANGLSFTLLALAKAEPDGVTDVRPFKVGDTVSSVDDLEALPNRTILREVSSGEAWEKHGIYFFAAGREDGVTSVDLVNDDNPFTVLWMPEQA